MLLLSASTWQEVPVSYELTDLLYCRRPIHTVMIRR